MTKYIVSRTLACCILVLAVGVTSIIGAFAPEFAYIAFKILATILTLLGIEVLCVTSKELWKAYKGEKVEV